jgi:hypothetical protein
LQGLDELVAAREREDEAEGGGEPGEVRFGVTAATLRKPHAALERPCSGSPCSSGAPPLPESGSVLPD